LPLLNQSARIQNLMTPKDIPYWLGFSLIPGIGPVRYGQLESHFLNLEEAWHAGTTALKQAGLDDSSIRSINQHRTNINLEANMEQMNRLGIQLITWHDPIYPARLKEIHDRPALLFVQGKIKAEDEWCLAIVGSRQPTIYGRQVSEEMATELAQNRITIVSGLARGIDTISHRATLAAGGRTLAVLGGGLDSIYPAENSELAKHIAQQGALISEYPPCMRPRPEYFPRRNRILSGLCLGVLVVEAGETSGALITAQLALEQNREVFAVPGSILSAASVGSNKLIQEGAKLVRRVGDILEELNLHALAHQMEMKTVMPTNDTEAILLKHLGIEPKHIDEICQESKMPAHAVSSTLAVMELRGIVKQVGTMNYALVREPGERYTVRVE
jgi:DNA processing protein